MGPEAYAFDRIGNEVIVKHVKPIKHVSVTMSSWALEIGSWDTGGTTTPGATFPATITLTLERYSKLNALTKTIEPGKRIERITKTFKMPFRPSSASASEHRFIGPDGLPHNGLLHTITFPVSHALPQDVVWSVSYNTATSGPVPTGVVSPTDSLNVAFTDTTRVGHDRFPGGTFWDGSGVFQLDPHGWDVPAARFSTR